MMKSFEPLILTNELVAVTKKALLEKLIPMMLLVSEKAIVEHSLTIDTTDITDNNSIKLARTISERVFNLLPQVMNEVGADIKPILGD